MDILIHSVERVAACVALIVFAPLLLIIAVLIKVDSSGPVLLQQGRIGRDRRRRSQSVHHERRKHDSGGQPFILYKFRTFYENAQEMLPERGRFEFDPASVGEVHLQLENDPRATSFGKWLRRSSLDELPNLLNVVLGEMRFVGPRPEVPEMIRYYREDQRIKFAVHPGLTGLPQVSGRGKLNFKDTVALDVWYVQNRSLLLDAKILMKTVTSVTSGHGSF